VCSLVSTAPSRLRSSPLDGAHEQLRGSKFSWQNGFLFFLYVKALLAGSLRTGQAIQIMGNLIAQGIAASVSAAVTGSQSFRQAMEQIAKSALAELAGVAVAKALEEGGRAASDFALAASFAADPFTSYLAPAIAAAGTAGIGSAIPSGSSSSSTATASQPTTTATNPATTTQQPVTDLCIMRPDPVTRELKVTSIHPGVNRETIAASTGWNIGFAENCEGTLSPTPRELEGGFNYLLTIAATPKTTSSKGNNFGRRVQATSRSFTLASVHKSSLFA
jgi:hypothetical protein